MIKDKFKLHWKNKYLWLAVALLVIVIVTVICLLLRKDPADEYDYLKVERGDIRVLVQETGNLAAEHRLSIMPPIPGRIDTIEVEDGSDVKQGQILAWMSSTDRAALLDAARARSEAEYERWKEVYKPVPLIAPLDGHLIATSIVPGQVVVTAQAAFVMSDRLILQAYVDETDLYRIHMDQKVEFTLSGFPEKSVLTGKVYQIAYDSTTVNNVTTYLVKVVIDNPPKYLRSGLSADVYFVINDAKNVLRVPSEFVSVDGTVLVATANDKKPEIRTIKAGVTNDDWTEVVGGLQEGDWVARAKFNLQGAPQSNFSFGPKFNNQKKNR